MVHTFKGNNKELYYGQEAIKRIELEMIEFQKERYPMYNNTYEEKKEFLELAKVNMIKKFPQYNRED